MKTERLTFTTNSPRIGLAENVRLVYRQSLQHLSSIFEALFVIDTPLRSAHGGLIRGLFAMYLFSAFIIFGPQAVLIMPAYQIGFKLLLRAAFQG